MPYIPKEEREMYAEMLDDLCFKLEEQGHTSGHVTYVLYMIVARWFKAEPRYNTIAKIRGCLIGTLAEFDRRAAAPYEDQKVIENGDVDLEYDHLGAWEKEQQEEQCCTTCDDEGSCTAGCVDNRGGA